MSITGEKMSMAGRTTFIADRKNRAGCYDEFPAQVGRAVGSITKKPARRYVAKSSSESGNYADVNTKRQ